MRETIEHEPAPEAPSISTAKLCGAGLIAAGFMAVLIAHAWDFNGPWYWKWPWRRLGWQLYPLMAVAAVPFFVGQWLRYRCGRVWPAIALLMAGTFALELAAISQQRLGLWRIGAIVENSVNTSYYSTAKVIVQQQARGIALDEWLRNYPSLLQYMQVHARYKPPGLVLYYVAIIHLFGDGPAGQMMGGLLIGLAATLAVPATYLLIRRLGRDEEAAFCGASFMALCPSLILFLPQFDQVYPTIAVAMVLTWTTALERKSAGWAIAYGGVLALATFMSYILLVIGFFLAAYTILHLGRNGRAGWIAVARGALLALATAGAFYWVLWIVWGFDPIATLAAANLLQEKDLVPLMRPFPGHILWDLYDFAMGSGWISYMLAASLCANGWRTLSIDAKRLVLLGLSQIAIVAAAAFLPGESARLWMLLYPFLMPAIGFELRRWPLPHRMGVYMMLLAATAVIGQNMIFLNMGEGKH